MVSDASKKKAAQKKTAAAAKRGGKAVAASSKAAGNGSKVDSLASVFGDLHISDRTCTGVLCSHPLSRDFRSELLKLMEEDLSYKTAQIDVENFNILLLESTDIAFIRNLEKGESDASNVATGYQQSVSKEIAVLSKLQAVEAANVELLEELSNVKREVAELENRLKKAKESLRL